MTPLYGVHGWDFEKGEAVAQFGEISRALGGREVHPFYWDTKHSLLGSWLRGFTGGYHRAWEDAEKAGRRLAGQLVLSRAKYVDLVCHSLGSRVVFSALPWLDGSPLVRKVLILNGSDTTEHAEPIVRETKETAFINVRSPKGDWVLRELGWKFVPMTPQEKRAIQAGRESWPPLLGFQGIPHSPPNWEDHVVGGDHWASFRDEANWPLLQEWMK